ncbi:MAG: hypothetical protein NT007_09760 [Candidatus Kapabacteria bacterium]|nr:hypothetical protein [Candidatus Kapabacteria bacterium]
MDFVKYQHIERFGAVETDGIENGTCYIFPKIDGTNSSLWMDNGKLCAGSRNRILSLESDNAGFYAWALEQEKIKDFFRLHRECRLYGEWLVPHTLKTYSAEAWRRFYVFDVVVIKEGDDSGTHIVYESYRPVLDRYGLDYIPPICKINHPTYEQLVGQLEKNVFLIGDGEGSGVGIVVKNYNYKNRFGKTIWAKIVKNEFKANHQKCEVSEIQGEKTVEEKIVYAILTNSLIEKEYAKIQNEVGWSSRHIPMLFEKVFYNLVKEEIWEILKKFKNPKIDFGTLKYWTQIKIKDTLPQLF